MPEASTTTLFGLPFQLATYEEALADLSTAATARPAQVVVTPNVDHIVSLSERPDVMAVYQTADGFYADGMPVVWASRWLGRALPERVTGADLFVSLCKVAAAKGWTVNVLGGMPGDEPMLLAKFAEVYPGLTVNIQSPAMGFDPFGPAGDTALRWVNDTRPHITFVCLGFPRQEHWALHHRASLDTGIILCVGAAMEFALGLRSRAPVWMQKSGLEWFWRLVTEPGKLWRRYLVRGPRFFGIVAAEWRSKRRV